MEAADFQAFVTKGVQEAQVFGEVELVLERKKCASADRRFIERDSTNDS